MNVEPDEVSDGYMPTTELWEGFSGHLTSTENSIVDANGNLLDENGYMIDWEGNRIDDEGYLLDSNGNYRTDENGAYIKSTHLKNSDEESDGISDTSVPGPLEDDEEAAEEYNDMESEGLTNEEAGLE